MAIVVAVGESRVCGMRRRSRIWQWQALEKDEICLERDSVESIMKPRFVGRQAGHYGFSCREVERGVDYFRGFAEGDR